MATQEASSSPAHSAQVVGNAFVEQYYQVLHKSPEHVFKFYQESSFLSRPDSDGNMTTVTTTQAINGKITSLNYEDYTAEIETADAQDSYERGVIVLVTGSLTGKDNVRRKFTQSFFLAPQDNGFFVLNDVFRFVEEKKVKENDSVPDNVESEIVPGPPPIPSAGEQITIPEDPSLDPAYEEEQEEEEEDLSNAAEFYDPSDNEDGSVIEEEVVEPPSNLDTREIPTEIELSPAVQEDPPKQSYASILKVARSTTTSSSMYIPTKMAPAKPKQPIVSAQAATQTEAPGPVDNAPEKNNVHEAEGHSIYVRNLPQNASVEQLEEVFKNFGPIKQGGIQVRSNKQGFCFGFVEFEELSSVDTALKSSPITIGDCQAVVEEKRTTTRVGGSGRGRYASGRGGFRSDSFRGRGGRGYGRSEFRGQGDFSGRPRGSSGRGGGDAYQRASQNGSGRGRGGRQSESPRA